MKKELLVIKMENQRVMLKMKFYIYFKRMNQTLTTPYLTNLQRENLHPPPIQSNSDYINPYNNNGHPYFYPQTLGDIRISSHTNFFSLGKRIFDTKEEEKKKRKRKEKYKSVFTATSFYIDFLNTKTKLNPIFSFLPNSIYKKSILTILSSFSDSILQRYTLLQSWSKPPFSEKAESWNNSSFWSLQIVQDITEAVTFTQKIRWIFRRFLHQWRITHLQKMNTEDIYTLEVPKYPVAITDWTTRRQYIFEASTLMKDITSRLQHYDGFFENPLPPRNPLTNIPFTKNQMVSIWNQLENSPITSSFVFSAFRQCRFNLSLFEMVHKTYLELYALRKIMQDLSTIDAYERLLDFIEEAYEKRGKRFQYNPYEYVVHHHNTIELIQRWKTLCQRYYEIEIIHKVSPDIKMRLQNRIWNYTYALIDREKEVEQLCIQNNIPLSIQREDEENHAATRTIAFIQRNPVDGSIQIIRQTWVDYINSSQITQLNQ